MTFASIFHFEFWFLWGVFLMLFWVPFGSLLCPKGVPWSPFGVIGGALGHFLGSSDVILAVVGCLGGPLGVPGRSWVVPGRLGADFRDFPGNSGTPFGSVFGSCLQFVRCFFGLCFLIDL